MNDTFLTVQEIADLLKISYDSALGFVKYSGVPFNLFGRQYRVDENDLYNFLKKHKQIPIDISEKC